MGVVLKSSGCSFVLNHFEKRGFLCEVLTLETQETSVSRLGECCKSLVSLRVADISCVCQQQQQQQQRHYTSETATATFLLRTCDKIQSWFGHTSALRLCKSAIAEQSGIHEKRPRHAEIVRKIFKIIFCQSQRLVIRTFFFQPHTVVMSRSVFGQNLFTHNILNLQTTHYEEKQHEVFVRFVGSAGTRSTFCRGPHLQEMSSGKVARSSAEQKRKCWTIRISEKPPFEKKTVFTDVPVMFWSFSAKSYAAYVPVRVPIPWHMLPSLA